MPKAKKSYVDKLEEAINMGNDVRKGYKLVKNEWDKYKNSTKRPAPYSKPKSNKKPKNRKTEVVQRGIPAAQFGRVDVKFSYKHKLAKKLRFIKQLTQPFTVTDEYSSGFAAAVTPGQSVGMLSIVNWTPTAILGWFTEANKTINTAGALNPNPQTIAWGQQKGYKMLLTNCYTCIDFVNLEQAFVEMDLYLIQAKNSTNQAGLSPLADWTLGLTQQAGGTTGGVQTEKTYGSLPAESNLFRENWKVIKKETFQMEHGRGITYKFYHQLNKMIDIEDLSSQLLVENLTTYYMIVTRTQPSNSTTAKGTASNFQLNYAPCKIGFIATQKHKIQVHQQLPKINELGATLTLNTNAFIMNEDTDLPVDTAVAANQS